MRLFILIAVLLLAGAKGSIACPNPDLNGKFMSFSADSLYGGVRLKTEAGGEDRIPDCSFYYELKTDHGDGYLTDAPNFTIEIFGLNGDDLEFRTESRCDSVLVVNTPPWNWYYDDDDNPETSNDSRVTFNKNPVDGIYGVWIGTINGDYCDARLIVETYWE